MLAFCGFDVVSTLAEETRTARRLIPQATILALLLYAGLIIVGMWALTLGGNASYLKSISEGGRMPINEVAQAVWGRGSIAITFTALSATLALMVATSVGASRILFAKGRRHAAPAAFAKLHPRYQVPWSALHVIFAAGIIMGLSVFISIGAYNAFIWWCTTSTFFAMLTFLFGNVACILLNRHRLRTLGGALLYGLVPALGIIVDLYILVQSFFIELWAQDWATGKSVVVFDVTCAVIALVVVLGTKKNSAPS
jgi:amino acid transporter